MRDPDARLPQPRHFRAIKEDAVRQPRIAAHPPGLLQQIERPLAEPAQTVSLFIACFSQVRVQPHAVPARQFSARTHQLRRNRKWRARRQRHPQHGARPRVVILTDQPLAIPQYPLLALHHRIRRQTALAHAHAHAAPRRVEADANPPCRGDLRVDHPAVSPRKHVVVVGGRGAAREHQLRHPRQRRHVHALFIEARPNRVKRPQPVEQLRVRRRSVGSRQCLIKMMVRVDQSRNRHRVAPADHLVRLGRPFRPAPDAPDLALFRVNKRAVQHTIRAIDGCQRVNVANQQRTGHYSITLRCLRISSSSDPSGDTSNGSPAAARAEWTSFSPLPVISATAVARRPTTPSSTARRNPATAVAAAGSAKTPASRPVYRIASRISSSLTLIIAPPASFTAITAFFQLRGTPTAMLSAMVLGSTTWSGPPLSKHAVTGAAPAACTPRIRGARSISPNVRSSRNAFHTPAMVHPSPTDTATQSGASQASCSPISSPAVFLPSTKSGLMPLF